MPKPLEQYTEAEIDALESGPEIRALVARDVMEWTLTDRGFYAPKGKPESYNTPDNWLPDSDIGAAYPIGERMKELGIAYEYANKLFDLQDDSPPTGGYFYALSHATPLQRCKAALKAVRAMRLREVKE